MDMRAGPKRLLASVVQVFGSARAHHGYLFANARATRIKLLVHDGFGVWCAARRLNAEAVVHEQLDAGGPRVGEQVAVMGLRAAEDLHDAGQEPLRPGAHVDGPGRQP